MLSIRASRLQRCIASTRRRAFISSATAAADAAKEISSKTPLIDAYKELIRQGKLRRDSNQVALIKRLAALQNVLSKQPPGISKEMEQAAEAAAKAEAEARKAAKGAALEARRSNSTQAGAAELATASDDDADAEEPPKAKYPQAPKGLFIWGEVGSGKSLGMDLFFATAQVQARRVHFQPFMLEVHQRIHNFKQRQLSIDKAQREEREQQQLLRRQRRQHTQPFGRRQLQQPHHAPIFHIDLAPERDAIRQVALELSREAALLCFDEFQVTDIADALILSKLFRVLWERRVVVVATSNRPPQDLYLGGLNRHDFLPFIRELQQHCVVFCMDSQTGQ
eukprot:TRINITY_DN938_c0_g2_i4.p1 TRINITY_DN938_c0_g2~~TRINITY_DN938_c0_g2_i4.p1  ORF type:complete len:337 (-),score=85.80 TRINITY_DN938_c0_g2_i4:1430-2440(-)